MSKQSCMGKYLLEYMYSYLDETGEFKPVKIFME